MKHKRKSKIIFNILYAVFGTVFIVSAIMLFKDTFEKYKENKEFEDLQNLYGTADDSTDDSVQTSPVPDDTDLGITDLPEINDGDNSQQTPTVSKPAEPALKRNLAELIKKNSDCVGWIYQKGTKINYPVMHTPSDPEKYLRRSFSGGKTNSGVPFVDGRCSLSGGHLILYGHNMDNGTMFGALRNYAKESYFTKNQTFELETTAFGTRQYKVFAVCVVKMDDYIYSVTDFKDEEKYNKFVDYAKSKSLYDTGITPAFGKQIVTLSTCYTKDETNRLVVLAVNA